MNRFVKRRCLGSSLTAVAIAFLALATWVTKQRLGHAAFLTGGTTLACVFLLILIGLRRRVPVLPLLSMTTWVQIHVYTGWFVLAAYWLHVPRLFVSGVFEGGLATLFWGCMGSGFYGLYASRRLPRKLSAVGNNEVRFEQIGWQRHAIAEAADALLRELKATPAAVVLADFYRASLQPFFFGRPSAAYVAIPNGTRRRRLLNRLGDLDRYLEDQTRQTANRYAALVRLRDDLDYQYALQFRMRVWLIVHAALSIGLLTWGCLHALLAIRFSG